MSKFDRAVLSKFDKASLAQWRELAADMERSGEGGSALHQHCKDRIAAYEAKEAGLTIQ